MKTLMDRKMKSKRNKLLLGAFLSIIVLNQFVFTLNYQINNITLSSFYKAQMEGVQSKKVDTGANKVLKLPINTH